MSFWGFSILALGATVAALLSPPEAAFAITYRMAVTLYPLMLVFWAAYALHQYRAAK